MKIEDIKYDGRTKHVNITVDEVPVQYISLNFEFDARHAFVRSDDGERLACVYANGIGRMKKAEAAKAGMLSVPPGSIYENIVVLEV